MILSYWECNFSGANCSTSAGVSVVDLVVMVTSHLAKTLPKLAKTGDVSFTEDPALPTM